MKKVLSLAICFAGLSIIGQAQVIDPKSTTKRKAEERANSKTSEGIDKGFDKAEEGIKNIFKKKDKKQKESNNPSGSSSSNSNSGNATASNGGKPGPYFKMYSKFDFVPGEKVIAFEDFSNTSVGDFPTGWNTNSSGEVVSLDGSSDKWLFMSKDGFFLPEFINNMPENFTLEFDVFTRYRSSNILTYGFYISAAANVRKELGNAYPTNGIYFGWEGGATNANYLVYENGEEISKNENITIKDFDCKGANNEEPSLVRLSIWRQKNRLRMYVNENKVLDIPQAFTAKAKYNSFKFGTSHMNFSERENKDEFMVANIRYAVGAPDTRSKLITEGKFVTRGILFDVKEDKIKASSYGTIKEIATVLKENPTVNVKIVGHTDSDGDNNSNLQLSQKRAAAVKATLVSEFGIDASRMQTDGKGEAEPSDSNATSQGKANNRRVEFIRL